MDNPSPNSAGGRAQVTMDQPLVTMDSVDQGQPLENSDITTATFESMPDILGRMDQRNQKKNKAKL